MDNPRTSDRPDTDDGNPDPRRTSQEPDAPPDVKVVDRRWWALADAEASTREVESRKPAYVEELERRAVDAAAQTQEFATRYRQAAQEFEETRVRLRREVNREVEREKRAILTSLLEIVDNLDRALDAARKTSSADSALLQGVELVRHQFLAVLERHNVVRVDPLNQPFDPAIHEAVSAVTVPDPAQDNIVVGIVSPGYRIGDEVLRPARVAVGRK